MLQSLSIQNFALIEKAELHFSNGFITITGETGSGKSILLGALNLILGNRADYSVIRDPEQKTIVEAHFQISNELISWFESNDIDFEQELVIRREIAANGKSRAFINDSLVQLNQLSELTEQLIYIHSQHETLAIRKPAFQFDLIDSFGGHSDLAQKVRIQVLELNKLKSNFTKLKANKTESTRELEFAQFQLSELESLELEKYNFEELEEELNRFDKLDELKTTYSSIIQALDNENGVLDTIRIVKAIVEKWKHSDAKLAEFSQRIESSFYELQDVSAEAQNQLENLEMNPERFEFLTSKLDKYNSCLSKNGCKSQAELQIRYDELVKLVSTLDASDERLIELEKEISIKENEAKLKANQLFEKRKTSANELKKHLLKLLSDLKLQSAKLDFDLIQLNELDPNGGMTIQLLFSANDGMDLRPIEKTASGGELSRLMLAIQATMSEKKSLPTLILDEIDTGVSGEVALRIGQLLQKMGQSIQVFAITHLPQVAAKGQSHLEVRKTTVGGKTITKISQLEANERVDAIAKLMSGETITLIAQQNAQQLLEI